MTKLSERLAVIDNAQKNITDLSNNVIDLQGILSNKQQRGAFGQGRMESIISDALPNDFYSFQYTLSNSKRPDCIIKMPCLLYTSPSPRDATLSRMPSSA